MMKGEKVAVWRQTKAGVFGFCLANTGFQIR
jgi:hypothetical protein